jgi:thymidylate synthase (FAD)
VGHSVVEAAEQLLDKEIKVLDKGFVRLVDYLGSDDRIVQSARVSYGAGTKSFREDKGLINYLMRNRHTSPFEQVILTFHTKMPIFVARQWVRHRTARLNEISGRYSIMEDEFYVPDMEHVAVQSEDNKQGRSSEPMEQHAAETFRTSLASEQEASYKSYLERVDAGVARELARVNLPVSLYTQWYWQIDLHNLFHFLALRIDPHAQYEIRAYAEVMLDCARAVAPIATDAFEQHMVGNVCFSAQEFEALQLILSGQTPEDAAQSLGIKGRALDRLRAKLFEGQSH